MSSPPSSAATEAARFNPSVTATKLKVTGINLFSAGDFADGDDREEIVLRDAARGVYRRLVVKDDRLIGIVLYGDVSRRRLAVRPDEAGRRHLRDARDRHVRSRRRRRRPAGPYGGRCSLAG